jgi:hypothetical protein
MPMASLQLLVVQSALPFSLGMPSLRLALRMFNGP